MIEEEGLRQNAARIDTGEKYHLPRGERSIDWSSLQDICQRVDVDLQQLENVFWFEGLVYRKLSNSSK